MKPKAWTSVIKWQLLILGAPLGIKLMGFCSDGPW